MPRLPVAVDEEVLCAVTFSVEMLVESAAMAGIAQMAASMAEIERKYFM